MCSDQTDGYSNPPLDNSYKMLHISVFVQNKRHSRNKIQTPMATYRTQKTLACCKCPLVTILDAESLWCFNS